MKKDWWEDFDYGLSKQEKAAVHRFSKQLAVEMFKYRSTALDALCCLLALGVSKTELVFLSKKVGEKLKTL